jgi:hypothetical protein
MQFVMQPLFFALASNKIFQDLECLLVTCLDSLGIVKNVTLVIGEHKLVVDVVLASLASCLEVTEEKYRCH